MTEKQRRVLDQKYILKNVAKMGLRHSIEQKASGQ